MRLARVTLIWALLAAAIFVPIAAAAASPLLEWRDPVYILACFAGHGFQFNSMRIRVQVGATGVRAPATDKKPLSKDAVHAIEQALQQLPASELRSALARLVRRRGERTRED